MNIRLIGATDQIQRLAKIIPGSHKIYPSRKNNHESLLYLDVDDRVIERLLSKIERNESIDLR